MTRYPTATPGGLAHVVEHRTTHRQPDMRSDFAVPAAQAALTGILGGGLCAAVAWLWGGPVLPAGVIGGLCITSYAWVARLRLLDGLLVVTERAISRDPSHEGSIGTPDATPGGHVMVVNPGQARQTAQRAASSLAQAQRLADLMTFWRACKVKGCAERAQGVKPGTPGQETYRARRDVLMRLGLAAWSNPDNHNAGWRLTVTDDQTAIGLLRQHIADVGSDLQGDPV